MFHLSPIEKIYKFLELVSAVINGAYSITALSSNAEAFTNNRTFQAVEPEKLTRKFYKNNFGALLGAGAYIWTIFFEITEGIQIFW